MRFKIKKQKGWKVKNSRPEEYLLSPKSYYTKDEVEKYSRSTGMRKAQQKIALRVLELLDIPESSNILDLGAGPGLTAEVYRDAGYIITCLDTIPEMLEKAKEKGFEYVEGDMTNLKQIFPKRKFDAVVSVSAVQWLKTPEEIKSLAEGINHVLKKGSPAVIQFYPRSERELNATAGIFKKVGFSVEVITDNPANPKKRTIFLVLKKS